MVPIRKGTAASNDPLKLIPHFLEVIAGHPIISPLLPTQPKLCQLFLLACAASPYPAAGRQAVVPGFSRLKALTDATIVGTHVTLPTPAVMLVPISVVRVRGSRLGRGRIIGRWRWRRNSIWPLAWFFRYCDTGGSILFMERPLLDDCAVADHC